MLRASIVLALLLGCSGDPDPGPGPAGTDGEAETGAADAGGPDGAGDTDGGEPEVPDTAADVAPDPGGEPDVEPPDVWVDAGPADPGPPPPAPGLLLTVNRIPAAMNGSLPYLAADPAGTGFALRVNRAGFTLDVGADPALGPVDFGTLQVVCDVDIQLPGGEPVPAGVPVGAGAFVPDAAWLTLSFSVANPAPASPLVSCAATASGPGGAAESSVAFETADLPPHLDPFVELDTWLVVTSRDIFELEVIPKEDGTIQVFSTYVPEGNGKPDLDEPLEVAGLISPDAPEAAAWMKEWLLGKVRSETYRIFALGAGGEQNEGSVRIAVWFEGDEGAPDKADFGSGGLSMIALGGDGKPEDQKATTVGRAALDWNNQGHEDNTLYGRGVFVTAMIRQILAHPAGVAVLSGFLPGSGAPFGTHPSDAAIVQPGFDPATSGDPEAVSRYEILAILVDLAGGAAIASTLCHEMGHSLGLVPAGVPPEGLFAGVDADFVVKPTDGAHIDTPGLNVMQTGAATELFEVESFSADFNPLNMAYLRRQLVVGAP